MVPGPLEPELFFGVPVFPISGAILAFLLAFYTLAARERKTPYVISGAFPSIISILISTFLACGTLVLRSLSTLVAAITVYLSLLFLGIGFINMLYQLLRVYNRQVRFRDDGLIKHSRLARFVKSIRRKFQDQRPYQHESVLFQPQLMDRLAAIPALGPEIKVALDAASIIWREQNSMSICTSVPSLKKVDEWLIPVAVAFLSVGNPIQYTTASRHPIEFVRRLRREWESSSTDSWNTVSKRLVAVDAFTPHYGFVDTTHAEWSHRLVADETVRLITSAPTYAGIHTSAAQAFNAIKDEMTRQGQRRPPTLVIYEGMYALIDLESVEQYRIFMRHVIPSERLWGGMLTVIAETTIADGDMAVVRSYSDLSVSADTGTSPVGQ